MENCHESWIFCGYSCREGIMSRVNEDTKGKKIFLWKEGMFSKWGPMRTTKVGIFIYLYILFKGFLHTFPLLKQMLMWLTKVLSSKHTYDVGKWLAHGHPSSFMVENGFKPWPSRSQWVIPYPLYHPGSLVSDSRFMRGSLSTFLSLLLLLLFLLPRSEEE